MNLYKKNIPWPTPRQRARWVGAKPHRVWLDSALRTHPRARHSILCGDPVRQWRWSEGEDPFREIEQWMKNFPSMPVSESFFGGGVVGFLSYEAWPDDLPWTPRRHRHLPRGHFMAVESGVILDHGTQRAEVFSWGRDSDSAREKAEQLSSEFSTPGPQEALREPAGVQVDFSLTRREYLARVGRIKEAIANGDFYQVNYAYPVHIRGCSDAETLYLVWRAVSPAPQMAFWNLPEGKILSASPEILLQTRGDRVRSFPIKGTRPRGTSGPEDESFKRQLLTSEKDAAELLMIVDLVRNDLGKFCRTGSITVPELRRLESFPHVHHLVAEVAGQMGEGTSPLEALRNMFPGGSITGAPKRKAMEWIHELEGRPRGIYTGSIGYWGLSGEACFNIAIRSGFYREDTLEYWVGSGIVADSDPELEFQETLDKLKGLLGGLGKDVRINLL